MSYDYPFAGLRVLDLSQGYAGPYCAALLSLYGAEVIKVEPAAGDWARGLGPTYGDQTAISLAANRGKKSIVLDLKSEGGRAVARDLAARSDVFIEGFRPGVCARFGLSYDDVRTLNPGVIYLAVSGYGHQGPYADRPCTDTVAQAFSGLMSINSGGDGVPHRVGHYIIDCVTALYAYQALSTALYARRDRPEGRFIDCNLMQAAAALQASRITEVGLEGVAAESLNAPAGTYHTSDGFLAITLVKEEHFGLLCRTLDLPELADDPRYTNFADRGTHMDILGPLLQQRLARETTEVWAEKLRAAGLLAVPVLSHGDWLNDPHVRAIGACKTIPQPGLGPMAMPEVPGTAAIRPDDPRQAAPALGQHGREVLTGLGYDEGRIRAVAADGAVTLPG